MKVSKVIRWSRRLSFVPRWSVVPTIRKQNVAEHSYHVMVLCSILHSQHKKNDDKEFERRLLKLAMFHDIEEAGIGDAPGPSKGNWNAAIYKDKPQSEVVLKMADILEAYYFAVEETKMGNNFMESIVDYDFRRATSLFPYVDWKENFTIEEFIRVFLNGTIRTMTKQTSLETFHE